MSTQSEPPWNDSELEQRQLEYEATVVAQNWTLANHDLMDSIQERMVALKEKYPRP